MILNPTTIEEIKANREEWASALESGKYDQAVGTLHINGSFCFLGVGCDITKYGYWNSGDYVYVLDNGEVRSIGGYISDSLIGDAYGLTDAEESELASCNDAGTPFPEIAAMIRALPLPESVTR